MKLLPIPYVISLTSHFTEKIETIRCQLYLLLSSKPANPPTYTPAFSFPPAILEEECLFLSTLVPSQELYPLLRLSRGQHSCIP